MIKIILFIFWMLFIAIIALGEHKKMITMKKAMLEWIDKQLSVITIEDLEYLFDYVVILHEQRDELLQGLKK